MAKLIKTKISTNSGKVKKKIKKSLKKKQSKIPEDTVEWFKDVLAKTITDKEYCIQVTQSKLKNTHFPRPWMKWLYQTVKTYIDNPKYGGKLPGLRVLKDKLEKDNSVQSDFKASNFLKIKDLYRRKVDNQEYSLEAVEQVIQREDFKVLLEDAAKNLGNFKDPNIAINTLVNRSFKISNQKNFEIVDLFEEVHERQKFRKHVKENPQIFKKFRFNIPSIDECIPSGLMAPMMASVAAKTGIGKSIVTVYCGDEAIKQNLNVTHITSENENIQTTGRYDSRITQVKYDDIQLANLSKEDEEKFNKKYSLRKKKNKAKIMIVKCNPNDFTAATVLHVINLLEAQGHKTEFLIIDSPDLMQTVTAIKDKRLQQSSIYWEVRSVLKEKNCIGMMTTQLAKGSNDENPIAEDLSESYDKARLLDFLMVLSRNKTQKANNEATLAIVKNRDGKTQTDFTTISTSFEIMSLEEKPKEEDPTEIDENGKKKKKGKFTVIEGGKSKQLDKLRNISLVKKKKKLKGIVKKPHVDTGKKIIKKKKPVEE